MPNDRTVAAAQITKITEKVTTNSRFNVKRILSPLEMVPQHPNT
jgi:hypothetical protein